MIQEKIAFGIVVMTVARMGVRFYQRNLAGVISEWILKKGHVKWAMRVRKSVSVPSSTCSSCK